MSSAIWWWCKGVCGELLMLGKSAIRPTQVQFPGQYGHFRLHSMRGHGNLSVLSLGRGLDDHYCIDTSHPMDGDRNVDEWEDRLGPHQAAVEMSQRFVLNRQFEAEFLLHSHFAAHLIKPDTVHGNGHRGRGCQPVCVDHGEFREKRARLQIHQSKVAA